MFLFFLKFNPGSKESGVEGFSFGFCFGFSGFRV